MGAGVWRDETSGQNRRRRTFNLNYEHPLVQQIIDVRLSDGGSSEGADPSTSMASEEPPEISETPEAPDGHDHAADVTAPAYTDYDDDDYELGKEAAEARAETGFISRLFRPRGTKPQNRR